MQIHSGLLEIPQPWLNLPDDADAPKIVRDLFVRSDARIVRNLEGYKFPTKCERSRRYDVAATLLGALAGVLDDYSFQNINETDELTRKVLVERNFISEHMAQGGPGAFSFVDVSGDVACMINENDHLVMRAFFGGLSLCAASEQVLAGEYGLGKELKFARDPSLGFLTSDPMDVGTGFHATIELHIPALQCAQKLARLSDDLAKLDLSLNGVYGEMPSAPGAIYAVSNKVTLGVTEREIIEKVFSIAQRIARDEERERAEMLRTARLELTDNLWRVWGVLRYARTVDFKEGANCISLARLGGALGLLPYLDGSAWKNLLSSIQPGHIRMSGNVITEPQEEAALRATRCREFMEDNFYGNRRKPYEECK